MMGMNGKRLSRRLCGIEFPAAARAGSLFFPHSIHSGVQVQEQE